jgi:hypothetical protein
VPGRTCAARHRRVRFPQAAACQENVAGPIEIPEHLLSRQTIDDTLHEALDVKGLESLLRRIEAGEVVVHRRDTTEASVLAHENICARPYAFLDDEEAQNRRTNAVRLRRGLAVDFASIEALDTAAIDQVHAKIAPSPDSADDLHDLLSSGGRAPDRRRLARAVVGAGEPGARPRPGRAVVRHRVDRPGPPRPLAGGYEAVRRTLWGHLELSGIHHRGAPRSCSAASAAMGAGVARRASVASFP